MSTTLDAWIDDSRETLADLNANVPLRDAHTGQELRDSDGNPDKPEDYEVLRKLDHRGDLYALVRGPSGQLDLYCDDSTGQRLRRNATDDADANLEDLLD